MKKITLFYLEHCPYCINARRALDELGREDPAYSTIQIKWIEESKEPVLANKYDYYYVPTIYYEDEKLYEADPSEKYEDIKARVKAALDTVLREG